MRNFCNLSIDELSKAIVDQDEPAYIAKQLIQWVYEKNVLSWEEMSNISLTKREQLKELWRYPALKLKQIQPSADLETYKFLWELHDGFLIESVLILSGDRRTVCVSSQVGCPAACAFCASGKKGFKRNLQAGEIVEQVVHINRWLMEREERVSHIVFMGMGEPLKNYENVLKAVEIFSHPKMLNISQRRITISTVGVVEGIKQLSHEGIRVNLVLSLHAPNQHIRKKIIPYARKYDLEDILAAVEDYATATKRDVTYEYTLIEGINDQPEHAAELAQLLNKKQCTVNLIPYNPVPGVKLRRPGKKAIKKFRSILFERKIINTCRYTKGDDIAAACGQLALQTEASLSASTGLPMIQLPKAG